MKLTQKKLRQLIIESVIGLGASPFASKVQQFVRDCGDGGAFYDDCLMSYDMGIDFIAQRISEMTGDSPVQVDLHDLKGYLMQVLKDDILRDYQPLDWWLSGQEHGFAPSNRDADMMGMISQTAAEVGLESDQGIRSLPDDAEMTAADDAMALNYAKTGLFDRLLEEDQGAIQMLTSLNSKMVESALSMRGTDFSTGSVVLEVEEY